MGERKSKGGRKEDRGREREKEREREREREREGEKERNFIFLLGYRVTMPPVSRVPDLFSCSSFTYLFFSSTSFL
jgi:hypothetical protein